MDSQELQTAARLCGMTSASASESLLEIHLVSTAEDGDNCRGISRSFLENGWCNFVEGLIYALKQPPVFQKLLKPFLYTYRKNEM